MSCEKFKILLSAYIDQEITQGEEKKLLEHLKTCSACTRELEYLKKVKRIFLLKEKMEPQEFFETRLLSRIKSKRKPLTWRAYLPMFKKSILAVFIFFLLVVGLLNYRNFVYQRRGEVISDLLIDSEIEESFEEELLEIYYGPLG